MIDDKFESNNGTSDASASATSGTAPGIVPEHLDELPDIENVEDYVGDGHVYDEETAGALVALMFAKEHRDEELDGELPQDDFAEDFVIDTPYEPQKVEATYEEPEPPTPQPTAPPTEKKKTRKIPWIPMATATAVIMLVVAVVLICIASQFEFVEYADSVTITKYNGFDTDLVIPSTINNKPVTAIGDNAFFDLRSLNSVVIPDGVTSIGSLAFNCCAGLTSVVIPASVTRIAESAFSSCDDIRSVYISDISAWCEIEFEDRRANPLFSESKLYLNGELVTELVIPGSVTSIGDNAFIGCSGITSIVIPDSVTSIGSSAFEACYHLVSVEISDSVTSIGTSAFASCKRLENIVIPESVTHVGRDAFRYCDKLTIRCEAASQPKGWHVSWNYSRYTVVWGYKSEE